jgi:hypothetical protein
MAAKGRNSGSSAAHYFLLFLGCCSMQPRELPCPTIIVLSLVSFETS